MINKRVCFVIPSLHAGGMERVMSELIHYFAHEGTVEVHVVLYGIKREVFYNLPHAIIIHSPGFPFNNRFRLLSTIKTFSFLRKKIKEIEPVSVLSFGEYWNNFVLIAAIGLKTNLFVSDRCQPDKNLGMLHNFLRRRLYPRSKSVIAQTSEAKRIYSSIYKANITVIPNPIRTICSQSSIERQNIVLSVGRLIDSKHHDRLIKIFLKINIPNWKLVIVGDNALKQNVSDRLNQLITMHGAGGKVILAGGQKDVDRYYLQSKIFAFTSSSEGFPNVIGEAMSAALPVVSYDCVAGPSEMVRDGINGFLVPLFDDESFCRCLKLLMSNESLRESMGRQAAVDVQRFSVDVVARRFFSLIAN